MHGRIGRQRQLFGDSGGPTFAKINNALIVAGVTSGGTGELCGAGWDLYTSVHAELTFIDGVMMAAPPPNPEPESDPTPDPDPTPQPDTDDSTESGGCNSGHRHASLMLFAVAALVLRRRRR